MKLSPHRGAIGAALCAVAVLAAGCGSALITDTSTSEPLFLARVANPDLP